ncbi:MAG TPA: penicillin-binding transpeptidase domain-containing protein, partial [Solirubrobacteraceae bacterium]|nr:penicillin-binding transpeptidase domain-containing protein [Solirubrobacteraceae bacterium]
MPIGVIVLIALGVVLVMNASRGRAERRVVSDYVQAWAKEDYPAMYKLLDPASRQGMGEAKFAAGYRQAASTATLAGLTVQRVGHRRGGYIPVQMLVRTTLWGTLHETLEVPITGSGSSATVHFTRTLVFPGLRAGERLSRHMSMPPRATLFAADGTPLAQGPDRSSPIPEVANEIAGVLGPIPSTQAAMYAAEGYPAHTMVGIDGLERAFQTQLAGKPGGVLLAGKRALARSTPAPGHDVTTTIQPSLEVAAIDALGDRYGGIAAMDPRTGALLALAGIAFSAPQPPGSTMKIITSTAALQAGIVTLDTTFPISTAATLDGYTLHNASDEACGGTLLNAFAVSCNSVFAPLGAKLGGTRLVAMAQRFGFDQPPAVPGEAESEIPSASTIGDDLAVGSSAIGQGRVQATVLEMTDVAATIAMGGRRPLPTLQ